MHNSDGVADQQTIDRKARAEAQDAAMPSRLYSCVKYALELEEHGRRRHVSVALKDRPRYGEVRIRQTEARLHLREDFLPARVYGPMSNVGYG